MAKQAFRQVLGEKGIPAAMDNRFYEQVYYANEDEILKILREK